ncbi:hypothetical protein EDB83DRAFT_2316810 [Lactarius deliciosus]|nr:hypothetical protein EDB83DRAFT_2316810 [Lactarius deliciosus]
MPQVPRCSCELHDLQSPTSSHDYDTSNTGSNRARQRRQNHMGQCPLTATTGQCLSTMTWTTGQHPLITTTGEIPINLQKRGDGQQQGRPRQVDDRVTQHASQWAQTAALTQIVSAAVGIQQVVTYTVVQTVQKWSRDPASTYRLQGSGMAAAFTPHGMQASNLTSPPPSPVVIVTGSGPKITHFQYFWSQSGITWSMMTMKRQRGWDSDPTVGQPQSAVALNCAAQRRG